MRNISLKQLRTFATAVRSGSFSAAARALNITPPAVTLQMQLLEEAVGLPLAERTPQGWRATEAGQEVLAAAHRIHSALEDCRLAIGELRGLERGRVTVATTPPAQYVAAALISAFRERFPSVDVGLTVTRHDSVLKMMNGFDADIALIDRSEDEDGPLTFMPVGKHAYVLVAAPSHPLVGEKNVSSARMAGEAFALQEPDSETRLLISALLSGQAPPHAAVEAEDLESIKQAVIAKLGLALLPLHSVTLELAAHRVALVDMEGTPVWRNVYAARHAERRFLPAAESFWEMISVDGLRVTGALTHLSQVGQQGMDTPPAMGNGRADRETSTQAL